MFSFFSLLFIIFTFAQHIYKYVYKLVWMFYHQVVKIFNVSSLLRFMIIIQNNQNICSKQHKKQQNLILNIIKFSFNKKETQQVH